MSKNNNKETEQCTLHSVIARLKAIPRFDINNYIVGAYETGSEREESDDGAYIDAIELYKIISDIEKNVL